MAGKAPPEGKQGAQQWAENRQGQRHKLTDPPNLDKAKLKKYIQAIAGISAWKKNEKKFWSVVKRSTKIFYV